MTNTGQVACRTQYQLTDRWSFRSIGGRGRRPAADRAHLSAGAPGMLQSPPQRGIAGRGAVDIDHHYLLVHLSLLAAVSSSNDMMR